VRYGLIDVELASVTSLRHPRFLITIQHLLYALRR
jgi:hypothetical protein